MPIIQSAKKRMRQEAVRRERNSARKDAYKSTMRQIRKDSEAGKDCSELVRNFQSEVDHAVKHNILRKNKAARLKHQSVVIAKASKGAKAPTAAKAKKPTSKKPTAKKAAAKKATAAKTVAKKPAAKKAATKKPAAKTTSKK